MPVDGDVVQVWAMEPTGPAVVMGSAQKPDQFRASLLQTRSVELGGRRSGGGAVYIEPSGVVWADLLVPTSSPLWDRDLVTMFERVGYLWQVALVNCGVETAMYAPGGPDEAPSSRQNEARLACWAGTGWGELLVGGTKVVGLSQRRTRWGARVQGMAVLDGSPAEVTDFLDVEAEVHEAIRAAIGPPTELAVDRATLMAAFVAAVESSVHVSQAL